MAAPITTSAGRLFDAVAALCGVRATTIFEGQAAMELEAVAGLEQTGAYELPVARGSTAAGAPSRVGFPTPRAAVASLATPPRAVDDPTGPLVLDARPTVLAVLRDLTADVFPAPIAARFHNALAAATATACATIATERGLATVVLSAGVFPNRLLLERTARRLEADGPRVLVPRLLPPNDGGTAYGQAAGPRLGHRCPRRSERSSGDRLATGIRGCGGRP